MHRTLETSQLLRPQRKMNGLARLASITVLAALALGCQPTTDSTLYAPGDSGMAEFRNAWRQPVWFGGCNAFVQQALEADGWKDRGGEVTCFWEGFAEPLAPRSRRVDAFTARDVGTWRLAYDVGFGCAADAPLNEENCRVLTRITSNSFEVSEHRTDEVLCTDTGGYWDALSCGHYSCGYFPECDAIIPGCDCGAGANFEAGAGCVVDPTCPTNDQVLCEDTGGVWDPTSCGHYICGFPPVCAAIIPGCNCGPSSVFEETIGCLAAPCGAPLN